MGGAFRSIFSGLRNFYFPADVEKHLEVKITFGRIFLTLLIILAGLSVWFFLPLPEATPVASAGEAYSLDQKVVIKFSRPVKRNEISFSISPDTEGEWSWQGPVMGTNHLYTELVFTPSGIFLPGTDYKVSVTNIQGVVNLQNKSNSLDYSFKTQNYPKISNVSPKDGENNVKIDSRIKVNLDAKNDNLAEFSYEITPKIEFTTELNKEKTGYSLKPKAVLAQNTKYNIKINRVILVYDRVDNTVTKRSDPELAYQGSFITQPAPGVLSFVPTGQVFATTRNMKIVFTHPMDRQSVEANVKVTPTTSGSFKWDDDKTLNFTAAGNLSYGRAYTFEVKKGAKNKDGGFIEKDVVYTFSTIGTAYVTGITPYNGATGVTSGSNIYVSFDQAVDHASAQSHFSLSGSAGSFSWSGNTMIFNPGSNMQKNSSYTATVSPGIKSINGLNSTGTYTSKFYTEASYVKLNIPLDYQDYPLSCEVASLKMALRYKGVRVSENTLMSIVGYDPTPHVGNTWGDPYKAFVGSLTGKSSVTGYGVYWGPIEKAAKVYRSSSRAFTGWSASQLAKTIQAGNPVVIWGYWGYGYPESWYTPGGKYIAAYYGEHARTVIGFYGSASNPTKFIINDPISGQITWTKAQLLANWSSFGYAGVVVY